MPSCTVADLQSAHCHLLLMGATLAPDTPRRSPVAHTVLPPASPCHRAAWSSPLSDAPR